MSRTTDSTAATDSTGPADSTASTAAASAPEPVVVEGPLVRLFGHPAGEARLEVEPRTRRWRIRRAVVPLAVGVALAPVVGLLPPHAPWAVAALGTGILLARRRWKEEFTIRDLRARCPRCGDALPSEEGSRLRFPHPLPCDGCGHEPAVHVDPESLRTGP